MTALERRVFWLTGLPGAGKTTIAKALHRRLCQNNPSVVLLDGDQLREVLGEWAAGFGRHDRKRLAFVYARLCRYLASQGLTVVCGTVSLFEDVRVWNRQNVPGYVELYVRAPLAVLQERDQKSLYSRGEKGAVENVPGFDLAVELPSTPDFVLENDGSQSPEELVDALLNNMRGATQV